MEMLHQLSLVSERDVVAARQHGRAIAESLGLDHPDQIRFATAVSEVARNAFRYATGGQVTFAVDEAERSLTVTVVDRGTGIPRLDEVLNGSYRSKTGLGMGLIGTKRLMDSFAIESGPGGTTVRFGKLLPANKLPSRNALARAKAAVATHNAASPLRELEVQNTELLKTLDELRERKAELGRINAELQDTNRGVVALYAELDERADYLRRASDLKSSFLSNMSHEFRTPLNSVLALTRMLLDRIDGELTPEQDQQLRFIQKSARELADMVDDLLDLAKVEAGRLEVKARAFEVEDLLGALRGMLRPLLVESSLHLVFEPVGDVPTLFTDEQKVSQILRNFISNALKFTPRGEVRVSAQAVGECIVFSVRDTGIGIAQSDIRLIFEEFAQVDSAVQRQVKGTGLGLPLSKKLAELLGGDVMVESVLGQGSIFKLTLPLVYPHAELSDRASALEIPELSPGKKFVLIVEDNPETGFIYTRYLSTAGFQPFVVANLEQARFTLAKVRPQAVLLDLMLRAETTWEYLRELKASHPHLPVLVMSVNDDAHRIFGLGADAFLRKPFVPEEMINELLRLTTADRRARVLLIDDNEVARYLLRGHMAEGECEIFEAHNGREGLRMAEELAPDVIILDYWMPDLSGVDVLRDLRRSKVTRQTPVVLHSTKVLDEADSAALATLDVSLFPKQMLALPDAGERIRALMHSLAIHSPARQAQDA